MKNNKYFIDTIDLEDEIIVSKTDVNGIIIYANEAFANISGYTKDELIGRPHNIVRHPNMPSSFFEDLWDSLAKNKYWSGCIQNKRKNGESYWVYTEIQAIYENSKVIAYESKRTLLDI